MMQKTKDRIYNILIGTGSGIAVGLFLFFLNKNNDSNVSVINDIKILKESKVDKIEFKDYEKAHEQRHIQEESRIIQHMDKRFEDTQEMIQLLHDEK